MDKTASFATHCQLSQLPCCLFRHLLLHNKVVYLLTSYEVSQLLQHLLSLRCQGCQGIWLLLSRSHVGLEIESRSLLGSHRNETHQRGSGSRDVLRVGEQVAFSQSVEISLEFRGQFAEVFFGVGDDDFEEAAGDFFFDVFGGQEDY